MQIRYGVLLVFAVVVPLGCDNNESYLPPPRISDEEAEAAAAAVPPSTEPAATVAASAPQEAPKAAAAARPAPALPDEEPAASQQAAAAADELVPDELEPDERQQRQQVIDQLAQIGRAWQTYCGRNESPPPQAFGPQRFSWRVLLLSELGEEALWARFSLVAPWDSDPNRQLLTRIPSAFRTPGDPAGRTSIVLVTGPATLYRGEPVASLSDGAANTILVVAVAASHAVPWPAPQDYEFDPATVQEALFGRFQDCGYALFGGQTGVRRIPATISDEHLLALLTPDGGEPVSAAQVTRPATAEPDEELLRYLRENPVVRFADAALDTVAEVAPQTRQPAVPPPDEMERAVPTSSTTLPAASSPPSAAPLAAPAGAVAAGALRHPVPDPAVQQFARHALREIHHRDYARASSSAGKRKLAEKLLALGRSLDDDPAGRFVALQACRKVATEAGAVSLGLEAIETLEQDFDFQGVRERAEVLHGSLGQALEERENDQILQAAGPAFQAALQADAYEAAEQILAAALAAARRSRDPKLSDELTAVRRHLTVARKAWEALESQIDLLQTDPQHPAANQAVGSYYCFVKQRWEDGLPLLAHSSDPRLVAVAKLEAERPQSPEQQLALGDAWWQLAERLGEYTAAIRGRAAFWYRQALPAMPAGLEKIRAEKRISRAETDARSLVPTSGP